jgi:hypothetical protein
MLAHGGDEQDAKFGLLGESLEVRAELSHRVARQDVEWWTVQLDPPDS